MDINLTITIDLSDRMLEALQTLRGKVPTERVVRPDGIRIMKRAQSLADENEIDVSTLVGTGKNGMIVQSDVQEAIARKTSAATTEPADDIAPVTSTTVDQDGFNKAREAMGALLQVAGRKAVDKVLAVYNVDRISAIPAEKYVELIATAQEHIRVATQ